MREYAWTIDRQNSNYQRIDPPLNLSVNSERIHSSEVAFTWYKAQASDVRRVMLDPKSLRKQIEGRKLSGKAQNADFDLESAHPVFYDLSGEYLRIYEVLIQQAQRALTGAVWYERDSWVNTGIERWKGLAGTAYTVDRATAKIRFRAGSEIQVNRDVVSLRSNFEEFAILPDGVVINGKTMHSFESIEVFSDTRGYVISVSDVPRGSVPRGYTWEYVNKDGSPDLRFNENEQLAIIDVCEIVIASKGSVVMSIAFSNVAVGQKIATSIASLAELARIYEESFLHSEERVESHLETQNKIETINKGGKFDVELIDAKGHQIRVIKTIRRVTSMSLVQTKMLIDSAPSIVPLDYPYDEAIQFLNELTAFGAVARITSVDD
jgi:ribosomal protein L7/L12